MNIGYACIPIRVPFRTNRSFMMKSFTEERFYSTVSENLSDLKRILRYNLENRICLFRISSDIIPFGSHPENEIKWWELFKDELSSIGKYIRDNNLRVSMHPGQYTVLNSPREEVALRAILDIEYHTRFLNSMELDYSNKIILHAGGRYEGIDISSKRFMKNFNFLSKDSKKRFVLENDEKCYNIEDILNISRVINVPVVFDILHHDILYKGQRNMIEILKEVEKTWGKEDGRMKLHYSDRDRLKREGAHSTHVDTLNFLSFVEDVKEFNPDIMLEVKDKDISAVKCICCLNGCSRQNLNEEWARYKYLVMERDYSCYKKCSSLVKEEKIIEFFKMIDEALLREYSDGAYLNTLQHVWGYFKDIASLKERTRFFNLIDDKEYSKAKAYLKILTGKYKIEYLMKFYYYDF